MGIEPGPQPLSSWAALLTWLRRSLKKASPRRAPGYTAFLGYDFSKRCLVALIGRSSERPPWARWLLPLPSTTQDVRKLWRQIRRESQEVCFVAEDFLHMVVVMTRRGIWESLPDAFLGRKKHNFVEVRNEENLVKKHADERTWKQMVQEAYVFGLSCRVLLKRESRPGPDKRTKQRKTKVAGTD